MTHETQGVLFVLAVCSRADHMGLQSYTNTLLSMESGMTVKDAGTATGYRLAEFEMIAV